MVANKNDSNQPNDFLDKLTSPENLFYDSNERGAGSDAGMVENQEENEAFEAAIKAGQKTPSSVPLPLQSDSSKENEKENKDSEEVSGFVPDVRLPEDSIKELFDGFACKMKGTKRVIKVFDETVLKEQDPKQKEALKELKKACRLYPPGKENQDLFFKQHPDAIKTFKYFITSQIDSPPSEEETLYLNSNEDDLPFGKMLRDFSGQFTEEFYEEKEFPEPDETVELFDEDKPSTKKVAKIVYSFVAIDCEWNDNHFVSVQLHFSKYDFDNPPQSEEGFLHNASFTVVFINERYKNNVNLQKYNYTDKVNGFKCQSVIRFAKMDHLERSETEIFRDLADPGDPIKQTERLTQTFIEDRIPILFNEGYNIWFSKYYYPSLTPEERSGVYFVHHTKIVMFYAIKDLVGAFGLSRLENYFFEKDAIRTLGGFLQGLKQYKVVVGSMKMRLPYEDKEGNVRMRNHRIKVCDLYGLTSGGLLDFAKMLGAEMSAKDELNKYKEKMELALINKTKTFLEYSIGDVFVLFQCYFRMKQMLDDIMLNVVGVPQKFLFPFENYPNTVGRLTSLVFKRFVGNLSPKYGQLGIQATARKYGLLKENITKSSLRTLGCANINAVKSMRYNLLFKDSEILLEKLKNHSEFTEQGLEIPKGQPSFTKGEVYLIEAEDLYTHNGVSHSNAHTWLTQMQNNFTFFLNWAVSGGRAYNDRSKEYAVNNILDVDLKSCYGTAISSLVYPLGIPTVIGHSTQKSNDGYMKLKECIDKYAVNSTVAPYQIVVSTTKDFSFRQTLIPSKLVSSFQIEKLMKFSSQTSIFNLKDVPTNFFILNKQIINGVITPEIWEVICKVCNNTEQGQFNNLRVSTGCFWLDKHRCDSIDEYIEKILKHQGDKIIDPKTNKYEDERPRWWFAVPLKDFIGKLVEVRNDAKNQSKTGPEEQRAAMKSKAEVLKLFINSFYGVCCSRFFDVGCTPLANQITAKARKTVWCLSRCLYITQTITDGGIYQPDKVLHFKENFTEGKPGMGYLSYGLYHGKKHDSVEFGSLRKVDWNYFYQNKNFNNWFFKPKFLDESVVRHFNKFWGHYNIQLDYDVEHKLSNIGIRAAYISTSHYAIKCWNPEDQAFSIKEFKTRGFRRKEYIHSPLYRILNDILENRQYFSFPRKDKTSPIGGKYTQFKVVNEIRRKDLYYTHSHLFKLPEWVAAYQIYRDTPGAKIPDRLGSEVIVLRRSYRFNNTYLYHDRYEGKNSFSTAFNRTRKYISACFERALALPINDFFQYLFADNLNKPPRDSNGQVREIPWPKENPTIVQIPLRIATIVFKRKTFFN